MANPWWVIVFTSEGGAPSYEYFQGTQAQAQARASQAAEVSSQQNLFGPYDTKADAQQAVQGKGANPVTAPTPGGGPVLPNPFTDVAHALSAFYDVLTNGKMWRSLGWLLLGVILMFSGIFMLIGKRSPAARLAGL